MSSHCSLYSERADTTFLLKLHSVHVTHKVSTEQVSTAHGTVEFLAAVHATSAEYFNSSADGGYESSNAIL